MDHSLWKWWTVFHRIINVLFGTWMCYMFMINNIRHILVNIWKGKSVDDFEMKYGYQFTDFSFFLPFFINSATTHGRLSNIPFFHTFRVDNTIETKSIQNKFASEISSWRNFSAKNVEILTISQLSYPTLKIQNSGIFISKDTLTKPTW